MGKMLIPNRPPCYDGRRYSEAMSPSFWADHLLYAPAEVKKFRKYDKNFKFLSILILPNINTSTKRVYENYTHDPCLFFRLNISAWKTFLREKKVDLIAKMCANMLEEKLFCSAP